MGLTVLVDARRATPASALFSALRSLQVSLKRRHLGTCINSSMLFWFSDRTVGYVTDKLSKYTTITMDPLILSLHVVDVTVK